MSTSPSPTEPEMLRTLLTEHDVPCPACGYNLRNLAGRVCPECSTLLTLTVSPADPLWRYRRVVLLALGLKGAHSLMWGGLSALSWLARSGPNIAALGGAALHAAAGVTAAVGAARLFKDFHALREHTRPVCRAAVLLSWIVAIESALWLVADVGWIAMSGH